MTQDISDLVEFSRERIEKGSKSFAHAARIFDRETRDSAYMLYAWCRHCDDVVDGQILGHLTGQSVVPSGDGARRVVEELEEKTRRACAGEADEPVFEALKVVAARHEIPQRYPLDLIAGFEMDAADRHYRSIDDTLEYCYHVAGVVGVMMTMVMGVRDRAVLDRACDLGLAFQLTNITRDIVADHGVGRVYLPADWLSEAGLSRDTLAAPEHRAALFSVAERVLDLADRYYASSKAGLPALGFRSAWAVAAAANVYRAIGTSVRRGGPAAWDARAGTSKAAKIVSALGAGGEALASRWSARAPSGAGRDGLWTMPD